MRIAVVILNWNTREYLDTFVPGILSSLGGDDALYVADSGSEDGSLALLAKKYPQVLQMPLGENKGFTGGYNQALSGIDAQYYLLLNSDVQVSENWLEPLSEWMETHADCGICAPKLLALDRDPDGGWLRTERFEYAGAAGGRLDYFGYPYCRGRILSKVEMDIGQYDTPSRVFWASGAALMIRSDLWHKLGGFDERFFAHMEEIDLCWRAQELGWQVWVVPQSVVYHIGGGTLPAKSAFKLKLNYRNSLWMLRKNLPSSIGPVRAGVRIAFRSFLDYLCALVYLLTGKRKYAQAVVQAHREARKNGALPFKGTCKVRPDGGLLLLQCFKLLSGGGARFHKHKGDESCN